MPATRHISRDEEGLQRAMKRGIRFYHTACGKTVPLDHLAADAASSDCGPCIVAARKAPTPPVSTSPLPVDLSDFDALDSPGPPPAKTTDAPYAGPDYPAFAVLATRLCVDPDTDPAGPLGRLGEFDPRASLTKEEREAAGPILAMVGSFPMAEPLLRTVWRLCHRVAWLEGAVSRQPVAVISQPPSAGQDEVVLGDAEAEVEDLAGGADGEE